VNSIDDKITELSTLYSDATCVEYRFSDPRTVFYSFPIFLLSKDLQSDVLQFKQFS
jgi:hypothetical protein